MTRNENFYEVRNEIIFSWIIAGKKGAGAIGGVKGFKKGFASGKAGGKKVGVVGAKAVAKKGFAGVKKGVGK